MPEGPELKLAAKYVNLRAGNKIFSEIIKGTAVSVPKLETKYPSITWRSGTKFTIHASSRGKELLMSIHPIKSEGDETERGMKIIFHFGMSGKFIWTDAEREELPKHGHLRFVQSSEDGAMNLSFCDTRRFGNWKVVEDFDRETRGPCIIDEYSSFRKRVIEGLESDPKAFSKPINEVLLNQKYFNGVGNYLRAEIMARANVSPFASAFEVLSKNRDLFPSGDNPAELKHISESSDTSGNFSLQEEDAGTKKSFRSTTDSDASTTTSSTSDNHSESKACPEDVIWLCHKTAKEVLDMAETNPEMLTPGYGASEDEVFWEWLTCYYQIGSLFMPSKGSNRTLWYQPEQVRVSKEESIDDIIAREVKKGAKLKKDRATEKKRSNGKATGRTKKGKGLVKNDGAQAGFLTIQDEETFRDSMVPVKKTR